jgi:hypothetical protein
MIEKVSASKFSWVVYQSMNSNCSGEMNKYENWSSAVFPKNKLTSRQTKTIKKKLGDTLIKTCISPRHTITINGDFHKKIHKNANPLNTMKAFGDTLEKLVFKTLDSCWNILDKRYDCVEKLDERNGKICANKVINVFWKTAVIFCSAIWHQCEVDLTNFLLTITRVITQDYSNEFSFMIITVSHWNVIELLMKNFCINQINFFLRKRGHNLLIFPACFPFSYPRTALVLLSENRFSLREKHYERWVFSVINTTCFVHVRLRSFYQLVLTR